jgi:hypothetical protein
MKTHKLKCWPDLFQAIIDERKNFEVRKNDRDFHEGDKVILLEFIPCKKCSGAGFIRDEYRERWSCTCKSPHGKHTRRSAMFYIGFVLHDADHDGLNSEYVVFSLLPCTK